MRRQFAAAPAHSSRFSPRESISCTGITASAMSMMYIQKLPRHCVRYLACTQTQETSWTSASFSRNPRTVLLSCVPVYTTESACGYGEHTGFGLSPRQRRRAGSSPGILPKFLYVIGNDAQIFSHQSRWLHSSSRITEYRTEEFLPVRSSILRSQPSPDPQVQPSMQALK